MTHPLVDQLRFARSEWLRALDGVSGEEARRRFSPMNSISWMVGHLASQENRYWHQLAQGQDLAPHLYAQVGTGKPATTPPLDEMWAAWHTVTEAADPYLDTLTIDDLESYYRWRGKDVSESVGTLLQRVIYHYWYHTGEAMAVRQMLGHRNLPEFVGSFSEKAHYRPR